MFRFTLLLCLLANVSFLLAPFTLAHAHIGADHESAQVHGGHDHDFDHHDDYEGVSGHHTGQIVNLHVDQAEQGANPLIWTQWLPLLCGVSLLSPDAFVRDASPRPPRIRPPLPFQHPPWPPPLRGPPLSI